MNKNFLWLAARLLVVVINLLVFGALRSQPSNFGIIAGLACGLVTFVVVFFWIRVRKDGEQHKNFFMAPFWPMQKYPRAYWSTIGSSIFIASLVNMMLNITDPHSVQLFGGLALFGLAMVLAVLCANLLQKRGRS